MNETTIVAQPESYLSLTDQSALDNRINALKGKITDAFRSKLYLMFDLEEIRWSGLWLNDEIWKQWDEPYKANGGRAPRKWYLWLKDRGLEFDDMDLTAHQSYGRWLCAAILFKLVEMHNSTSAPHCGAEILPLPTSVTQVDALVGRLNSASEFPESWVNHPTVQDRASGLLNHRPILPAEQQTHIVGYWQTAWGMSKRPYGTIQSTGERILLPPSRDTVRLAVEQIGAKAPKESRTVTVDTDSRPSESTFDFDQEQDPDQPAKRDKLWDDIQAKQQFNNRYTSDQQQRIQEQAKESQAQQEHRQRLFRWNELLVAFKRSVNDMSVFVNEIDRTLGTQYFAEMREMKVGLITVSDDMDRVMEGVEVLRDICGKLASHNPPSGIEIRTVDTEVN